MGTSYAMRAFQNSAHNRRVAPRRYPHDAPPPCARCGADDAPRTFTEHGRTYHGCIDCVYEDGDEDTLATTKTERARHLTPAQDRLVRRIVSEVARYYDVGISEMTRGALGAPRLGRERHAMHARKIASWIVRETIPVIMQALECVLPWHYRTLSRDCQSLRDNRLSEDDAKAIRVVLERVEAS